MQLKWPMLWDLFSLFPAHAGEILTARVRISAMNAFPRTRGGDPVHKVSRFDAINFSPHTRG